MQTSGDNDFFLFVSDDWVMKAWIAQLLDYENG